MGGPQSVEYSGVLEVAGSGVHDVTIFHKIMTYTRYRTPFPKNVGNNDSIA